MKKLFFTMLLTTALAAVSAAQSAPAPSPAEQEAAPVQGSAAPAQTSPQAQNPNQFPAGTLIPVELSKSVDSKKAKAGDKIEAKTATDLLSHGKVAIPRNTKIIGHVTDAKAHSKESPDAMVGIAFDRISMKDGRELPIQAAVQAMARPLQSAPLSSSTPSGGADIPSGTTPTTAGGDMGASIPAHSSERVPSILSPTSSGTGTPASGSSTVAPLGPNSQGVVGMKGLSLKSSEQGSVISSETENVHLDSGTQLILRTQ